MKPWWSLRGPERAKAKAADEKRNPSLVLMRLCAKHGLRFDSNIRAQIDGEKLTLSNGVSHFVLTLKLIDKAYLENVLAVLNKKETNGPPNQS